MWVLQERKRNQNQETIEEELVDRDLLWMQTWCPAQFNAITSGLSWIRKIPFQDSKIYTLFFFFPPGLVELQGYESEDASILITRVCLRLRSNREQPNQWWEGRNIILVIYFGSLIYVAHIIFLLEIQNWHRNRRWIRTEVVKTKVNFKKSLV